MVRGAGCVTLALRGGVNGVTQEEGERAEFVTGVGRCALRVTGGGAGEL